MTAPAAPRIETGHVRCTEEGCGALHEATYSHEGRFGEGAIYEVVLTCTPEWFSEWFLAEMLVQP